MIITSVEFKMIPFIIHLTLCQDFTVLTNAPGGFLSRAWDHRSAGRSFRFGYQERHFLHVHLYKVGEHTLIFKAFYNVVICSRFWHLWGQQSLKKFHLWEVNLFYFSSFVKKIHRCSSGTNKEPSYDWSPDQASNVPHCSLDQYGRKQSNNRSFYSY